MQHFWRQFAWTLGVSIIVIAMLAGLNAAMTPDWKVEVLDGHMTVDSPDTAIRAKGISTPKEGTYEVHQQDVTLTVSEGHTVHAIVREPVGAPDGRPACVFVHGAGTGKATEAYGDLGSALASAGITTIVQDKRLDNYTALSRDYESSADDYLAAVALMRGWDGVDASKVGVYAESEGTWITTVMTKKDHDLGFVVLTSAPVYSGRRQMAMAATEYLNIIGAPDGVVQLIPRLTSLDLAPLGLQYADFDADDYRDALTMPVLINYGTIDPSMPVEQGAQQLIHDTQAVGNDNVLLRYYPTNHQMRTGSSLSLPGLPLVDHYTANLEDWINAIAAGATADDWTTPRIAGSKPYQEFAVPTTMHPGLVRSLVALGVILLFSVLMWLATVVMCFIAVARRKRSLPISVRPDGRTVVHRFAVPTKALVITNVVLTPAVALGFVAYFVFTAQAALSLRDQSFGLQVGWVALKVAVLVSIALTVWMWVRLFFFYGPGSIDPDTPKEHDYRMSRGHTAVIVCCSLCTVSALVLATFFDLLEWPSLFT